MGPHSIFPTIGYVWGLTYLIIFLVFSPFIFGTFRSNRGIRVRLLRPWIITAAMGELATGLLVYVDRSGILYLNSKRITEEELRRALEDEFARRSDWSVYVEGDSELPFSAVIRAMDLMRGAHGKVILLTPEMRAEEEAARR
jgi:biopolymer transport protein ExbD